LSHLVWAGTPKRGRPGRARAGRLEKPARPPARLGPAPLPTQTRPPAQPSATPPPSATCRPAPGIGVDSPYRRRSGAVAVPCGKLRKVTRSRRKMMSPRGLPWGKQGVRLPMSSDILIISAVVSLPYVLVGLACLIAVIRAPANDLIELTNHLAKCLHPPRPWGLLRWTSRRPSSWPGVSSRESDLREP
jgi:hypothetical protein